MDKQDYQVMFLAESREYLQSLNNSLLEMENSPENTELIQEMFRSAHSLKGMSATMGYDNITKLTHEMESLLQLLREGTLKFSSRLADVIFEALDFLENLLLQLEDPDAPEIEIDQFVEKLRSHGKQKTQDEKKNLPQKDEQSGQTDEMLVSAFGLEEYDKELIKESLNKEENVYALSVTISENSLLKSARAYMVIKVLEEHGDLYKIVPSLNEIEDDNFDQTFYVILQSKDGKENIEKEIKNIPDVESLQIETIGLSLLNEEEKELRNEEKELSPKNSDSKSNTAKVPFIHKEKTVRVDTAKLDQLINLVGELVINRTRLVELIKESTNNDIIGTSEQLDQITSELQSAVMRLRMVPIKQVFDRFTRMVRDLSKERGKNVRLEILGEETELDRSIVNQIGDPLVHLLRNAVDHGIESVDDRTSSGKNPQGCIRLEARHEGSFVVIEVRDDGYGLDEEKIIAAAVKKGIITKEDAKILKGDSAFQLIFANGFSTAKEVTDISGRGVGMDAVRNIVASLNGFIEVDSVLGEGTRFTIRLPLTLAIIKALLVEAQNITYAIPLEEISENLLVSTDEIMSLHKQDVIYLRNEVIPLVYLHKFLNDDAGQEMTWDDKIPTVIVAAGGKKVGLMVDQLIGQQEIVIKSLSSLLGKIKGIAGATVLGNGNVALILNIDTLI